MSFLKLLTVLCIIIFHEVLIAHPHMFIEYSTNVVMSENGLEGLQMTWYFDDMFSWQVVIDYTEDEDFNISPEENKILEKEAFSYLVESGYFAEFFVDSQQYEVKEVSNFKAECIDETLVYHFFIPWRISAGTKPVHLKICFFDETIFCEIVPRKESFQVNAVDGITTEYSMPDRITYQFNFWKE